jgi:FdhE protein
MLSGSVAQRVWDQRIARAKELAKSYTFAAEILTFYQEIASFQKALFTSLKSSEYECAGDSDRVPEYWDSFTLLPKFPALLDLTEKVGPAALAEQAKDLSQAGVEAWDQLITRFWMTAHATGDEQRSTADDFLALALLQPYAEYLSARVRSRNHDTRSVCPFCSRNPVLGILRPEGDGAKRSLLCSLCSTEWDYRRIVCPACNEQRVEKLPIFTADSFEFIRVEACDSCKTYIKTVDLTKNGRAVPIVDELAAIPLSLWAEEHGYRKLPANLLST